jgi:hypothetical protein
MVPVVIAIFVVIFAYFVAVPVCLMAIAVSISIPRYLPAAVPAVVAVMIIDYRALISRKAPVVAVMIVSPAVVSVVVIPLVPQNTVIAEARIISEARFIRASPFPIFPLALTVEPVVFNIVVPALGKPFPIVRIVVSVVAAGSAICVWVVLIPMLRASSGQNRSRSQS